jgi:hypothetical protein
VFWEAIRGVHDPKLRKGTGVAWNDKYGLVASTRRFLFCLGNRWGGIAPRVSREHGLSSISFLVLMLLNGLFWDCGELEMMGGGCDGVAVIISMSVDFCLVDLCLCLVLHFCVVLRPGYDCRSERVEVLDRESAERRASRRLREKGLCLCPFLPYPFCPICCAYLF